MGEVHHLFPGDENRPKAYQRKLNFSVQSPEEKVIRSKADMVIRFYSDMYSKDRASALIPNPKPRIQVHHKKRIRDLVEEVNLLTSLMFVYRFWEKNVDSGEYETVVWAENRNIGAFVSDAAIEELKNDRIFKSANLPTVNRFFSEYLEGFGDDI